MEDAESRTILWVRSCEACRTIDGRDWFPMQELAAERSWQCPRCGGADYRLLRTKW